ncbi:DUF1080 domain-containing protein [Parabacteroides sp. Marseille-P3160]|uniref:3-keto-disaccharide hydrolase n=1 Tax=Parabacteroides sp. Marseille-P3160 TaxID=1917887 RepID=UPI0009BBA267|nr:DUF1080 domain-containing protein [Parabacteroides sp. Marseille-P3160]
MKGKLIIGALLSFSLFYFSVQGQAQKIEKLFNGKDFSNWNFIVKDNAVPPERVFTIKDGLIHITGDPFGYMYTKKKYSNFKLHVEWRWPKGVESNSGIFVLIEEANNPFPNGIECQLKAGDAGSFVLLGGSDLLEFELPAGTAERPAFPVVQKAKESSEKPAGEWNEANIFVKDGTITVFINGVYQNVGTNPVKEGYIGLQSEGKDIQFRNVTLTERP